MPENKNQHFVSEFYLRNFSYDGTNVCVHILSTDTKVSSASVKDQASKSYLYWKWGQLELFFSSLEWKSCSLIQNILYGSSLFKPYTYDHYMFLFFLLSLKLRNPLHKSEDETILGKMNKNTEEVAKAYGSDTNYKTYSEKHGKDFYTKVIKRYLFRQTPYVADLKFIILKNKTKKPFFTSDYPVVYYNKFLLEPSTNIVWKVWHTQEWLMIILPLSSNKTIMFYDSKVYDVWWNNQPFINIDWSDVDSLNLLQYWNSNKCLYYQNYNCSWYIEHIISKWREVKNEERNKVDHLFWWHVTLVNEEIVEKLKPPLKFISISKEWKKRLKKINTANLIIWAHLFRNNYIQYELHLIDEAKKKSLENEAMVLEEVYNRWGHLYNYIDKVWDFIWDEFSKL